MNFAERLKEERKRLKIKQKDLAEELGVTVQGIIHYEKGDRKPSIEYIDALIKKGADIQYIYTGEYIEARLASEEKELLELFRNAPSTIKQAVKAVLTSGGNSTVKSINLGKNNNLQNSKIKISQ